jgi:hypothetical protein
LRDRLEEACREQLHGALRTLWQQRVTSGIGGFNGVSHIALAQQLHERVGAALRERIASTLRERIEEAVHEQLDASLRDHVHDSLQAAWIAHGGRANPLDAEQLADAIRSRVGESLRERLTEAVRERVSDALRERLGEAIRAGVRQSLATDANQPFIPVH